MDVTQKIISQILSKCHKAGYDKYTPSLVHFICQSILISGREEEQFDDEKAQQQETSEANSTASNASAPGNAQRRAFSLLVPTPNSSDESTSSTTLTPSEILKLIEEASALLCQENNVKLCTVLMQNSVLTRTQQINNQHAELRNNHLFKSEKLIDEIVKKHDEAEVFGDIVLFILHETRLLNDSTERIEKETMTALESVIPRNFIHSFITQDQHEKKNQLYDLWKIVWGIRLFNKASDKGGAGIERLTIHDPQLFAPLSDRVQALLQQTEPIVQRYASCLERLSKITTIPSHAELLDRVRQEYTNRRQLIAFLNQIQKKLVEMQHQSQDIQSTMNSTIENVHEIVNQRTSVPKSTIYPLFIDLAENWLSTEDIYNQYVQMDALYNELHNHTDTYEPTNLDTLEDELAAAATESEADTNENQAQSNQDEVQPATDGSDQNAQRVRASATIEPEFGGFDPIHIVSGAKLLREGDSSVDYVHYMDRYYAFESEESVNKFLSNPQKYLEMVLETVSQESDLIHLLNLEDRLPKSIYLPGDPKRHKKQMVNVCMQTEVHPLDGYIDPKYEWSEWKLRKLALKFANLRNKRTHSTQTQQSHFRREGETQVSSKPGQPVGSRTRDQQTRKENGTNPIQHVNYIKGLRSVGDKAELVQMHYDPNTGESE